MTPAASNNAGRPQAPRTFRFPDFEVSWAGEMPSRPEICVGSEDGRLLFTNIESGVAQEPIELTESGEAVNGVAFLPGSLAVSTRSEVVIWKAPEGERTEGERSVYDGGAHGVISTPSGVFYAPLGVKGLLAARPQWGDFQELRTLRATGRALNFYKAAGVGASESGDVLVCAARRDGIVAVVHGPTSGSLNVLSYSGVDVVDVCQLGLAKLPFAAAALGSNGSIYLIRDVLNDRQPQTLRLGAFRGTAYRILVINGHLLLLSSLGIYIFLDVLERFHGGIPPGRRVRFRYSNLQAVDAAAAFDRWLLVVKPDGSASAIDIQQQPQGNPYSSDSFAPVSQPVWEDGSSLALEYAAS